MITTQFRVHEISFRNKVHVFVPFKWTTDKYHNQEIAYCLRLNMQNPSIDTLHILSEDHSIIDQFPDHAIILNDRPTFSDWLRQSQHLRHGDVTLIVNADILIQSDLSYLSDILDFGERCLATSSRYEFDYERGIVSPHHNPKTSQDMWALRVSDRVFPDLIRQCEVPIGVQGCDNKIAYVLLNNGFSIFNTYLFTQHIHLHKGGRKMYSQAGCPLSGGMAHVWPAISLERSSLLQTHRQGADPV